MNLRSLLPKTRLRRVRRKLGGTEMDRFTSEWFGQISRIEVEMRSGLGLVRDRSIMPRLAR